MKRKSSIAILAALAALIAASASSAAPGDVLTLSATPNPVVRGQSVTVQGRLTTAGGTGIAGASVDLGIYSTSACTARSGVVSLTTGATGSYSFGPYSTTGLTLGDYYLRAVSGTTQSSCLHASLVLSLPAPVSLPSVEESAVYLCYSRYQTVPGVWLADQALALFREGYWEPTAVDWNLDGAVNVGAYRLECNVTPTGDGFVDEGGNVLSPELAVTARQELGFYAH